MHLPKRTSIYRSIQDISKIGKNLLVISSMVSIHSDQSQCFESKLIKDPCSIADVEKSRATPYHPIGNGQVERFNKTFIQMFGTLDESKKSYWKAHVSILLHAYNSTFHDSIGFSPFLCFGVIPCRHRRLYWIESRCSRSQDTY